MISHITNNIYIGTIFDAIHDHTKWGLMIWVAEYNNFSKEEVEDLLCQSRPLLHIPFMVYNTKDWFNDDVDIVQDCHADISKLDYIAWTIRRHVSRFDTPILVFCAAGVERSPLAVIWYLHTIPFNTSLEDAFNYVKAVRPIVENRLSWIRDND